MEGYEHIPLASPTSNANELIIPLSTSFPAQLQMGSMDPFDNALNYEGENMLYVQPSGGLVYHLSPPRLSNPIPTLWQKKFMAPG